jgi:hypothetical protein
MSALFKINKIGTLLNSSLQIVSSNGSNREWAEFIMYLECEQGDCEVQTI